jgi:hypothetical protein
MLPAAAAFMPAAFASAGDALWGVERGWLVARARREERVVRHVPNTLHVACR